MRDESAAPFALRHKALSCRLGQSSRGEILRLQLSQISVFLSVSLLGRCALGLLMERAA